jgi:hypothetical protein
VPALTSAAPRIAPAVVARAPAAAPLPALKAPAPAIADAPRPNPALETAVKKSGATKSEWLVVLQPEAASAEASAKAAPEAAKPHVDAKAEHALSQREYEAYIAKKRREPYSNL